MFKYCFSVVETRVFGILSGYSGFCHYCFSVVHVRETRLSGILSGYSGLCHYCFSVVHVRETRLSGILSHVFIGLSMFLLPDPLSYIPRPVLNGLFLYVAITALFGNQFFERILLLITEQVRHKDDVCMYI